MAEKNKTLEVTPEYVQGTVADLIGRGEKSRLRINGKPVGQPELSVLARLGIAEEVGVADRPEGKRGPAAKILRLATNGAFAAARK